jgi:hypothetical protein
VVTTASMLAPEVLLMRRHAAQYGVVPDLTFEQSPWLLPQGTCLLLGWLLGMALGGAAAVIRERGWRPLGSHENVVLAALALCLAIPLAQWCVPAALDVTLSQPHHTSGVVGWTGGSQMAGFERYRIVVQGHAYTSTQAQALESNRACVQLVYGPDSSILFDLQVTLVC